MNTSTFNTEINIYTYDEDGQLNWESPFVVKGVITVKNDQGAHTWEAKVNNAVKKAVKTIEGTNFYYVAKTESNTKVISTNYSKKEKLPTEWHKHTICEGSYILGDGSCPRCSVCLKRVMC